MILLLQTLLVILIAFAFTSASETKYKIGVLELLLSFSTLIVITSLAAWTGNSNLIYSIFLILIVISLAIKIKSRKKISFENSFHIFWVVLLVLSLLIYFSHGVGLEYRLFINSDPNGYGVVTGAVDAYGSFPELLKIFEKYTGLPFEYNYNWDNPTQFPLLESPWLIPDALVKYGIANGYYLHNGISFLAIPLLKLATNPVQSFSVIWAFWSLVGASMLISIIYEITRKTLGRIKELTKRDNLILALVTTSITSGSFFILIFILEGFGNQLLSLSQALGAVLLGILITEKNKKRYLLVFSFVTLLIANWFTYAQQVPFTLFAFVIGVMGILNEVNPKQILEFIKKKFAIILILSFSAVPVLFLLIRSQGITEAFRALTKGAGGGALHLGAVNPLSAIGLGNLNTVQIIPGIESSSYINLVRKIWPNSAYDNLGWELVEQGYALNLTSMGVLKSCSILIFFFCCLVLLTKKHRKFFHLALLAIPTIILIYYYLFVRSGNYLKQNMSATFSDYVWVRILSIMGVFTLPLVVTLISNFLINLNRNRKVFVLNNLVIIGLTFILLLRLTSVYTISKDHVYSSQKSYISRGCPDFLSFKPSPYLITDKIVPEISLGLCGKELNLLTDSFPVSILSSPKEHEVIRIERVSSGDWNWAIVGKLTVTQEFKTPCDLRCLRSKPGFTEYLNVNYANLSK